MITGTHMWCEEGRVTAHLNLAFDQRTGAPDTNRKPYPALSIYFDRPILGFIETNTYAEPEINVEVPKFKNSESAKADAWLKAYAKRVDKWLGQNPAPQSKEPA
jgi:hypothetical protein